MAATVLEEHAKEESTYIITVAVTDEDDAAVTPQTLTWTLSDTDGVNVNSRADVDYETDKGTGAAGTLSTSMEIVLNGDDLAIQGTGATENRVLTIEGTYNSDAGNNLPFKDRVYLVLDNLAGV